MSKITKEINQQNFEFIRDRILQILVDEFEGQFILSYDDDLDLSVYVERSTPIDKTEIPAIVISLSNGNYNNKNQGCVDGTYVYNIDFFTNAKSSEGISGDTLAATKLQKIMGVGRAILEDPIYKTLGVTPPFVMKTFVSEMNIAQQNKEDAENTSMGRLLFNVVSTETTTPIVPSLIEGFKTAIKIDQSGKGYFYSS